MNEPTDAKIFLKITESDYQVAAAFAQRAVETIDRCNPNPDDCSASGWPYYLRDVARLLRNADDDTGEQVYFGYGYRDALKAEHLLACHSDLV